MKYCIRHINEEWKFYTAIFSSLITEKIIWLNNSKYKDFSAFYGNLIFWCFQSYVNITVNDI